MAYLCILKCSGNSTNTKCWNSFSLLVITACDDTAMDSGITQMTDRIVKRPFSTLLCISHPFALPLLYCMHSFFFFYLSCLAVIKIIVWRPRKTAEKTYFPKWTITIFAILILIAYLMFIIFIFYFKLLKSVRTGPG